MTIASAAGTITKVTARLAGTIGSSIDAMWALREEKRGLEEKVKVVEEKIKAHEEVLLGRLDQEDTTKSQGKLASVSITSTPIANVEDWESFWKFIIKGKHTQLLQKRVSDPAYRELMERGIKVPGVTTFVKRRINLRSLT